VLTISLTTAHCIKPDHRPSLLAPTVLDRHAHVWPRGASSHPLNWPSIGRTGQDPRPYCPLTVHEWKNKVAPMDMQTASNGTRPDQAIRPPWCTRLRIRRCPIPDQRLLRGQTADREAW